MKVYPSHITTDNTGNRMELESEHASSSQSLSSQCGPNLGVLGQPWPIKFTTLTKNNNTEQSRNLDSATTGSLSNDNKIIFVNRNYWMTSPKPIALL